MADTKNQIREGLSELLNEQTKIVKLAANPEATLEFGTVCQCWYTRALKTVQSLALEGFTNYYFIDLKRKVMDGSTYAI